MTEPTKPKPGWRIARRILIVLAVLTTFIAVFYTEEDWRGKRAWKNCKCELEAQGVVLDWNKFLPPNVPDDQNFYAASTNILQKFKQLSGTNDPDYQATLANPWLRLQITASNSFPVLKTSKTDPLVVASIIISPSTSSTLESGTNTLAMALNDPTGIQRSQKLIRTTVGQSIDGVQGFKFSERQLTNIQPAQIFLRAQTPPSIGDLENLIPSDSVKNIGQLQITATANQNIFQVSLTGVRITAAADYLKWSDQFVPAFNEIREALKRPYAILPGDYSNPASIPIPNFVMMRALAQTLGQRTQCYLLLGEPDKALHELKLIHDVCRILEKPPTGQPETLVEAMIDVAITGLYEAIIQEGFQRHAWQEPQLEALQEQLTQINLPPIVKRAFDSEIAASARTLEILPSRILRDYLSERPGRRPGTKIIPLLKSALTPTGWIYQNMVTVATLMYRQTAGFDSPEGIIQPKKFTNISREFDAIPMRYKFIAAIFIPNVAKAWQTTASNQTLVNQAQIACALERYRMAHGEYPDTLDALVPQFIESIPHDIIGGQPLHYRPTADGKFSLYSVGWNGIDDGGKETPHSKTGYTTDYSRGDWVWMGVRQ